MVVIFFDAISYSVLSMCSMNHALKIVDDCANNSFHLVCSVKVFFTIVELFLEV